MRRKQKCFYKPLLANLPLLEFFALLRLMRKLTERRSKAEMYSQVRSNLVLFKMNAEICYSFCYFFCTNLVQWQA